MKNRTLEAIKKIYSILGFENPDILSDIANNYLTEHTARNGRNVLWYLDLVNEVAIYTDTLDALSTTEIINELC